MSPSILQAAKATPRRAPAPQIHWLQICNRCRSATLRRSVLAHGNVPGKGEKDRASPRCEAEKSGRAAQALVPSGWQPNSPGRFRHGKEFFEASQTFIDAIDRGRIR